MTTMMFTLYLVLIVASTNYMHPLFPKTLSVKGIFDSFAQIIMETNLEWKHNNLTKFARR